MLTRKYYKIIADAVRRSVDNNNEDKPISFEHITNELSLAFEKDNPRFNKLAFIEACGGIK